MPDRQAKTNWEAGKTLHKALSNAVATQYDAEYAVSNFATASYMGYEIEVIDRAIELIDRNRRRLAVDLGSGTGRDTFHLHKYFRQVRGYDFSEEMIRVAEQKKLLRAAGNVLFVLRDIEEDLLTDLERAAVSFVGSSFGMGSFVRELSPLLNDIKRVLEPEGIFVISFYNREALVVQLNNLQWAPSLTARLNPSTEELQIQFSGRSVSFPVRAYSLSEVRAMLHSNFEIVELSTFPTLTSLFPQALFDSPRARELCTIVDRELRCNEHIAGGPYIVAICRRRGKVEEEGEPLGYINILRLFADKRIIQNIRQHRPVKSPEEVAEALGVPMSELIKTMLLRVNRTDPQSVSVQDHGRQDVRPRYYAVVLQADRRIDMAKLALVLQVKRDQMDFVPEAELEHATGFAVGGIPPFGYPRAINVILDARIKYQLEYVYCGTGKSTESLRIRVDDVVRLASPVIVDISKS